MGSVVLMATSENLKFRMKRARAEAKAWDTSFRVPEEESDFAKLWRSEAQEKFAAHPEFVARPELPADIQEIADLNFRDRLNVAIARSCNLLNEAQAQLEAPFGAFLPNELTPEEIATRHEVEGWDFLNAKATEFNDVELALNEGLSAEVNKLLGELDGGEMSTTTDTKVSSRANTATMEEMGVPSDIATWIAESKEAGKKARAKTKERKLLANAKAKAEELSGMIAMRLR